MVQKVLFSQLSLMYILYTYGTFTNTKKSSINIKLNYSTNILLLFQIAIHVTKLHLVIMSP